jgi:hypothetical protein
MGYLECCGNFPDLGKPFIGTRNIEFETPMRERWIVALVTLYFVIILGGTLFIGMYALPLYKNLNPELISPIENSNSSQYIHNYTAPGTIITQKNVTVYTNSNAHYEGPYKPNITITRFLAQDYHIKTGAEAGNLYIDGNLNNTGDGIAYEIRLRIVAMNAEGKAIDASIDLGGLTPHMTMGVSRQLNYNGSALVNCNVTIYYLDLVDAQNRPRP